MLFVSINNVLLHPYSSSEGCVRTDWACVKYSGYKIFLLCFNFANYTFRSILYTFNGDTYKKRPMSIVKGNVIIKIHKTT